MPVLMVFLQMKSVLLSDETHGNSRSILVALKVISLLNIFTDLRNQS